eukprot:1141555-Pelagomonas_calceolata.AAC.1
MRPPQKNTTPFDEACGTYLTNSTGADRCLQTGKGHLSTLPTLAAANKTQWPWTYEYHQQSRTC